MFLRQQVTAPSEGAMRRRAGFRKVTQNCGIEVHLLARGEDIAVTLPLWGCPQYSVYSQRLEGEAVLARAEYARRVAVIEAQAKLDSDAKLAEAEIARAKGVAQANQIIGQSLKDNEGYLRYLWIDRLDSAHAEIIYVPTEAGLPILEAGRHLAPSTKP